MTDGFAWLRPDKRRDRPFHKGDKAKDEILKQVSVFAESFAGQAG